MVENKMLSGEVREHSLKDHLIPLKEEGIWNGTELAIVETIGC